jgi:hypothetical protein
MWQSLAALPGLVLGEASHAGFAASLRSWVKLSRRQQINNPVGAASI